MTASDLNPDVRQLIDARLDAIDRVLATAAVSWSERRSIVGEVETQIFELLARRSPVPSLDDATAVLAALDPPESYLPDAREPAAAVPMPDVRKNSHWKELAERAIRWLADLIPIAAGAAALLIVDGIAIGLIAASEGAIAWVVTIGVIVWLNYVAVQRYRTWSASRSGSFVHDLRQSLGSWVMPNGAQAT